jgi:hypothetical protein
MQVLAEGARIRAGSGERATCAGGLLAEPDTRRYRTRFAQGDPECTRLRLNAPNDRACQDEW